MIKKIKFHNYKSFKYGEIELKPINILLGANSVGKSSIIQLISMLQQTSLSEKYKSALRLNGEYVSLGENSNIFNNKDISKILTISFDFESDDIYEKLTNDIIEKIVNRFFMPFAMANKYIMSKKMFYENDFVRKNFDDLQKDAISSKEKFIGLIDKIKKYNFEFSDDDLSNDDVGPFSLLPKKYIKNIKSLINLKKSDDLLNDIVNIYDLFDSTRNICSNLFEISFDVKNYSIKNRDVLKLTRLSLNNDGNIIFEINFEIDAKNDKYLNVDVKSEYAKLILSNIAIKKLINKIKYESTIFNIFEPHDYDWPYYLDDVVNEEFSSIDCIVEIFESAMLEIKEFFEPEMINHVSPLRAHPKRYYFLDKSKINLKLDTLDGDALTEVLKEKSDIKSKVNKWLKKFDFEINIQTLEDVIHKLKVNQNGLNLDITDVGFGLSQILPVIVQGFLSEKSSLTIIEQPEIHLHPKMQADLADLFIDISTNRTSTSEKNYNKFLLIETHSEYLLKRLRRRLSEKNSIKPSDVSIYFFNPGAMPGSCEIEAKAIDESGGFEWPKNFYSGELLLDTVEFIKNQRY